MNERALEMRWVLLVSALVILASGVAVVALRSAPADEPEQTPVGWNADECRRWRADAAKRIHELMTGGGRITAFLEPDIGPAQRSAVRDRILALPGVVGVRYESKQEAFQVFSQLFEDQAQIVENTDPGALPESYRVSASPERLADEVVTEMRTVMGVEHVRREPEEDEIFEEERAHDLLIFWIRRGYFRDARDARVILPAGCPGSASLDGMAQPRAR